MAKLASLLFIVCLLLSNSLYSVVSDNTQDEINYLISHIESSKCIFNRNGTDYKGSKVVSHIKKKYDYFNEDIKITEDFIALSATKSEISGKKYTVRCDDETEELGKWLLDALAKFRN